MDSVSCTLVTREARLGLVGGAIDCFRRQSYGPRELVVVYSGSEEYAAQLRAATAGTAAVLVGVPEAMPLGAARNVSVARSNGDVICQWDDDDLYHPDRVRAQLDTMLGAGADACYLCEQYYLFREAREVYVRREDRIHGTAMFRKGVECRYPETGPRAARGEDTAFLECLSRRHRLAVLPGRPELYLRVFHGANTWDADHHRRQVRHGDPAHVLRDRRDLVTNHLRDFHLSCVTVMGSDGPAFDVP